MNRLVKDIIVVCEDLKASDIRSFEVNNFITDYFIICTINSKLHSRAVFREMKIKFKHDIYSTEATSHWAVINFSSVILHIMTHNTREHYNLEELWSKK